MKLTLELSETQAYILRDALDAYSRLLAGQVGIPIMDAVPWMTLHNARHPDMLDKLRSELDQVQSMITGLGRGTSFSLHAKEVPDRARQTYDILQVIRHSVANHLHPRVNGSHWTVDHGIPRRTSEKEELPKCEVS